MASPSLPELVERARCGDERAWAEIYTTYFDRVFRYVRVLVRDEDLAQDLTQETFAQAITSMSSFRGQAQLSTWLHGIALNVVRRHWRWQRSTKSVHTRLEQLALVRRTLLEHPDRNLLDGERLKVLYAVLAQLPDMHREAFILKDLHGFSERELAEQLGVSVNTAAVRASRARARVRAELTRLGWITTETEPA